MGWDDQVTCIQTIDQIHVQAGNRRGGSYKDDQMGDFQTIDKVDILSGEE